MSDGVLGEVPSEVGMLWQAALAADCGVLPVHVTDRALEEVLSLLGMPREALLVVNPELFGAESRAGAAALARDRPRQPDSRPTSQATKKPRRVSWLIEVFLLGESW